MEFFYILYDNLCGKLVRYNASTQPGQQQFRQSPMPPVEFEPAFSMLLLPNTAHYTIHCWVYRFGLTFSVHVYRLLV